ncbi:ATP-binding protein [Pseudonocardia sp. RS11V-5]|uniref:ATP-binding protein n=1 Tax=Pseudonocardia terrae TaxID=2905831 RepID=UPI001E5FB072|nr:ATP-binding protein [Pseudonocardia terrae]MCE3556315.1 ATP-binding protein [Pseudonocardia terrae]
MSSTTDGVLERKVLAPDPGLIKSLGAHHSLESAVADLVDNSVDAGATRVLIVFETENGEPVAGVPQISQSTSP